MYTYMNNPGWVPRAGVLGYRGRMGWAYRAAERLVMHAPWGIDSHVGVYVRMAREAFGIQAVWWLPG